MERIYMEFCVMCGQIGFRDDQNIFHCSNSNEIHSYRPGTTREQFIQAREEKQREKFSFIEAHEKAKKEKQQKLEHFRKTIPGESHKRIPLWFDFLRTSMLKKNDNNRTIYVIEVKPSCTLKKRFDSSRIWKEKGLKAPLGYLYVGETGKKLEVRYGEHLRGYNSNIDDFMFTKDFENRCRTWTERAGFISLAPRRSSDGKSCDWESYVGWSLAQEGYIVFGPHEELPKGELFI